MGKTLFSTKMPHEYKKGVFITALNTIENLKLTSWAQERMPDYLWLSLIIKKLGRIDGLKCCKAIIEFIICDISSLSDITLSSILALEESQQRKLFDYLKKDNIISEAIEPLTAIITFSINNLFSASFYKPQTNDNRVNILNDILKELYDPQSNLSTDTKYLVVYFMVTKGTLKIQDNCKIAIDALSNYSLLDHEDEMMKMYRPSIRSLEGAISNMSSPRTFPNLFWEKMGELVGCLLIKRFSTKSNCDGQIFLEKVKNIIVYYNSYLICHKDDERLLVLLGVFSYSFRLLKEFIDNKLFEQITGRFILRTCLDLLVTIKMFILEEKKDSTIWNRYIEYGIGQYKIVTETLNESTNPFCCMNISLLSAFINDYKRTEFINMDVRYFWNGNIKNNFSILNMNNKYIGYNYLSSFEHGLWGSIEESCLLKCAQPGHKYHWVLDVEGDQALMSVYDDMNKIITEIISEIDKLYPLPKKLKL